MAGVPELIPAARQDRLGCENPHIPDNRVGCHHRCVEYFTLAQNPTAEHQQPAVDNAVRRAWNACAAVACPKCGVAAWQYCRDRTAGISYVARFHRARQDAAGADSILRPIGVNGLSWAKGTGRFAWDGRRVPAV